MVWHWHVFNTIYFGSKHLSEFWPETRPPVFWTPYSDFGDPKISQFTIEKIGTGYPIITQNE